MGPRGAGRRLNDQERMEILDILARESKVKNVDLAKRYGVSEGAIRKLKQIKDTIRDRYYMGNEHNRDKRKRGGFMRNAPFEQELYEWICRMRETQAYQLIPLTQTAVRQQAIVLAKNYERMGNFKASPGWFARFCSRHRLDPPMNTSATGAPPSAAVVSASPAPTTAQANDSTSAPTPPASGTAAVSAAAATSAAGAAAVALVETKPLPVSAADESVFLMQPLDALTSGATTAHTATTVGVVVPAVTVETKAKPEVTPETLKDPTALDEQAKLAAREHNEAVMRATREAVADMAASSKVECDAITLEKTLYASTAEETKAAAPAAAAAQTQQKEKQGEEASAPAAGGTGAAVAAPSEDEIFSLGL